MRDKIRFLGRLCARHSKSVRLDDFTYEVIINYRGSNFSEKLRNYVFDAEKERGNESIARIIL